MRKCRLFCRANSRNGTTLSCIHLRTNKVAIFLQANVDHKGSEAMKSNRIRPATTLRTTDANNMLATQKFPFLFSYISFSSLMHKDSLKRTGKWSIPDLVQKEFHDKKTTQTKFNSRDDSITSCYLTRASCYCFLTAQVVL